MHFTQRTLHIDAWPASEGDSAFVDFLVCLHKKLLTCYTKEECIVFTIAFVRQRQVR